MRNDGPDCKKTEIRRKSTMKNLIRKRFGSVSGQVFLYDAAQDPGRDCSFQSKKNTVCRIIRQNVLTCDGDLNVLGH